MYLIENRVIINNYAILGRKSDYTFLIVLNYGCNKQVGPRQHALMVFVCVLVAVLYVSLTETDFTVVEEDLSVQVCANLTGEFERMVKLTLTPTPGTAKSK